MASYEPASSLETLGHMDPQSTPPREGDITPARYLLTNQEMLIAISATGDGVDVPSGDDVIPLSSSPTAPRIKLQVLQGSTKSYIFFIPILLTSPHSCLWTTLGSFPIITLHMPLLPDPWSLSLLLVSPAWAPLCPDLSMAASFLSLRPQLKCHLLGKTLSILS